MKPRRFADRTAVNDDEIRIPLLERFYADYVSTHDTATFLRRTREAYYVGSLCRLASCGGPLARRAAVLALGSLGDYDVNHVLGQALRDDDRVVRGLAETSIRAIWRRTGTEQQQAQLKRLAELNSAQQYGEAARLATELIEAAPWFAEAWNQRAVAYFRLKRFRESVRDCHQTLEFNPYHFGAASGMGHCYLHLNEPVLALGCFRRALEINPGLEGVRAQATRLERRLEHEP